MSDYNRQREVADQIGRIHRREDEALERVGKSRGELYIYPWEEEEK